MFDSMTLDPDLLDAPKNGGALESAAHTLEAAMARLEKAAKARVGIAKELEETKKRSAAVSTQVADVSARLDGLIARLSQVLGE